MENIYESIIKHYGADAQIIKTCEELSELQTVLLQQHNKVQQDKLPVREEMADVYIMLDQLRIIYGISPRELAEAKQGKISRTLNRISEGKR